MGFRGNRYNDINLEISVKKDDLLTILKKNRETHKNDFEKAIYFWRKDFKIALSEIQVENCDEFPNELERMRNNCPESCLKEYDDVIDMFEMSVNETIILTSDAYRKFCKDEWSWKSDAYGNWYYKNLKKLEEQDKS